MNKMPRISLFIITKNEEKKIAQCILSARPLVNEIIVVDSLSTDHTVQVCKDLGALVFSRPFDSFTKQKNFALSKVTCPWALSLDADETLTPELVDEIKQELQNPTANGYELGRINDFLGKRMLHGGLKKEYILRLVRTEKSTFQGGLVHEKLTVQGTAKRLKAPFVHYSYDDVETYFEKFNKYTTLAARTLFEKGKRFCLLQVLLTIPFEFARRYILKLGFLDGIRGLIWASFSAFYVFVKYIKLWYLWQQKRF